MLNVSMKGDQVGIICFIYSFFGEWVGTNTRYILGVFWLSGAMLQHCNVITISAEGFFTTMQ